jgi:SLT domain-containing protein
LIRKMIELGTPGGQVISAIANQALAVQGLIDKYGDANGKLHEQLNLLLQIAIAQGLTPTVNPESGLIYYELPKRAAGGPVSAGKPYLVGEDGPEVMVPDGSGRVLPHRQQVAMASARPSPFAGAQTAPGYASRSGSSLLELTVPMTITVDGIGTIAHGVAKFSYDNGGLPGKWTTR